MGLSAAISNALTGMSTGQSALEVISRNVSNSGTPGYHRQSLSVIDTAGANSIFARSGGVQRAFNQSLQAYYTSSTSKAAYTSQRNATLDRLQTYLGQPGGVASLDTQFANFQNSLQTLSTSPDDYATRATVVSKAQSLVQTLNTLSQNVQALRQETETQITSSVNTVNQALSSLVQINQRLSDQSNDPTTRAALLDQRDRLVSQVSEQIDVQVSYRPDDTVALMTKTGVGILDGKASTFQFQPAGTITADKQFNVDPSKNGVGTLTLVTASGLKLDLVQQNVLQSGQMAALIDLRDKTLVNAQSQLDQIAAGLAQSLSTVTTNGTAASSGAQSGLSLDLSAIRNGNDFTLSYTDNGTPKTLRVVNVADASKLPLDYIDANGARVVGLDFSSGAAAVATQLGSKVGSGVSISGSGNTITFLDDGAANTTDIGSLVGHSTATALQNGDAALNLFVDSNNSDFTNSLDGRGQALGFANRIAVNSAVLSDNKLLVQYQPGGTLGDATRANYMLDQLQNMQFATPESKLSDLGEFRLGGSVSGLISQTMDYTGTVAATAKSDDDIQQSTMDSLSQRMTDEYGVNVDEEMARLVELQNAYAANSRVISVVQQLMNKLLEI